MRQLETTEKEKALMLDIIINDIIGEYNEGPSMDRNYHSKAEKIGYKIITVLNDNGFITNQGIQGK